MLYDRKIIGTSSEIFGYLRQSSEIFGKCSKKVRWRSSSLRKNFGKSSEIFGKWSEIFGKSSKTSLLVCLYNKQNITCPLVDMNFIFSCSTRYQVEHSKLKLISRPRHVIAPLHDPLTWHGINYTGTQITQWDFQNKGKSGWTGTSSFVLEVPLRNLRPSVIYSVPCDRIVQMAYCYIFIYSYHISEGAIHRGRRPRWITLSSTCRILYILLSLIQWLLNIPCLTNMVSVRVNFWGRFYFHFSLVFHDFEGFLIKQFSRSCLLDMRWW